MLMGRPLSARGFSLIELMITLVILAILLTLAVPNFQSWIRDSKVRSTTEALQNDLRLAQQTAVANNRQTILVLTNATPGVNAAAAGGAAIHWYVQQNPSLADIDNGIGPVLLDSSPTGTVSNIQVLATQAVGTVSAVCFSSLGRQMQAAVGVNVPAACTPGDTTFAVTYVGATARNLDVQLGLGGTVRWCDPNFTQAQQPFGC